jgi:transposase
LPHDHIARLVWQYVECRDVAPWLRQIKAVEGHPGRDANDPRLLIALWLYATIDGVGSARRLDRLCRESLGYQWLCGGVSMNYHDLADFRADNPDLLDELLTDSVTSLLHEGLIDLGRTAQDSLRVRAHAGAASFRRRPTLEACRQQAQERVESLRRQADEDPGAVSRRERAAQQRAARERLERVEQALREHEALDELRQQQRREKGTKYEPEKVRASTTDPEARRMKMADGGTRPAYNLQFTTTTVGGVVVGVAVTNAGNDAGQMAPMMDQIEQRYDDTPAEHLVDGSYTALADIEAVHQEHGVKVYGPIKEEKTKLAKGQDPYAPRPKDGPGVRAWRERMGTEQGKAIAALRGATAEWLHAGMRNRGLYQVRVRGADKVRAVGLWHALAHNLLRAIVLRKDAKKIV